MVRPPATKYADVDGAKVAYQVVGSGSGPDLIFVPGLISHLEVQWHDATYRRFALSLAAVAQVIRYDKLGTGLSDPVADPPRLEDRTRELAAVADTTRCSKPFLLGYSEGGPIAIAYAASHPGSVRGLILCGTYATAPPPWAMNKLREMAASWGEGASADIFAPALAGGHRREERAALERASASPAMVRALVEALGDTTVVDLLSSINTPTLIIHRRDEFIPLSEPQKLAKGIPGARLVVLEGQDHLPWIGDSEGVICAIAAFLEDMAGPLGPRRPYAPATHVKRPLSGWASLTEAEVRVVLLLTEGLSNPEIADRLYLSRHTVETHLKHVFAKLGVVSRAELVSVALASRNT